MLSLIVGVCFAQLLYAVDDSTQRIDRYGLVNRHNVGLDSFDKMTPLSVGNGKFDSASHVFERDVILSMMLKANAYQQTHPVMKENDRNWQRGTWYTGVMAVYRATGDVRFLQQAMDWAKKHAWQVGTEPYGANLNGNLVCPSAMSYRCCLLFWPVSGSHSSGALPLTRNIHSASSQRSLRLATK